MGLAVITFFAIPGLLGLVPQEPARELFLPEPERLLEDLRPAHPRLLADGPRFARIKVLIGSDEACARWFAALEKRAAALLRSPPSRYLIPDGLRLLATSRRVFDRVQLCSFIWRITGKRRYLDRAMIELETAARFKDWNPRHFLDTAEMCAAFAIGYDWLWAGLDERRRTLLVTAIVNKGLKPALACYTKPLPHAWWTRATHNWNQVCNGGIALGALAVADVEPELAGRVLREALVRLPRAMAGFAPAGGWAEGPGYWGYATAYNTLALASVYSALGKDFGMSKLDGFERCGLFPIHVTGPTGKTFNFADSSDRAIRAPQMFWLANRFSRPEYHAYAREHAAPGVLDLVWYEPARAASEALPLDSYFAGVEVVTMRSAWKDKKALFVAFKGGDNAANHGHLDLGSFVLDALGQRFALDLGRENYNLPGYWSRGLKGRRWHYYRTRAEGHNTIVLGGDKGPDQGPLAKAKVIASGSKPERAFAVVDLSQAYRKKARSVRRGIAMLGRKRVLVQDEVDAKEPTELSWSLHTRARIELAGARATLTLGDARLALRILEPAGARFLRRNARPGDSSPNPRGQGKNRGVMKLVIRLEGVEKARLAVLIEPMVSGAESEPVSELRALADW